MDIGAFNDAGSYIDLIGKRCIFLNVLVLSEFRD